MFNTSLRDNPCNAFDWLLLMVGDNFTCAPSTFAEIKFGSVHDNFPREPSTFTVCPWMPTFTPDGISTGLRPSRDIGASFFVFSTTVVIYKSLPNVAEHFAAEFFLFGFLRRHHAFRGGQNRGAQSV